MASGGAEPAMLVIDDDEDTMSAHDNDDSKSGPNRLLVRDAPQYPENVPLPTHLILLLTHIVSLCESVSKCSMQMKRFFQHIEERRCINSFRQLRSCHKRCVIINPEHLSRIVTLCKEGVFEIDKFVAFADTMEGMVRGSYFLEGYEIMFIRSQFHFVYNLIKQARFEMTTMLRFNFIIVALLDKPSERNSELWNYAVAFFPYVLELAQARWKLIASNMSVDLDLHTSLPTLFVSKSMEHLQHKFVAMIEREPKAYVRGGDEDFSTDSSCSDDDDSDGYNAEERRMIVFDMKHQLKIDGTVSDEVSASDDEKK